MNSDEKIALLKEHARNERYKKEPIANILLSLLIKKGILSKDDYVQVRDQFDEYMGNQVDYYFRDLNDEYNPIDDEN